MRTLSGTLETAQKKPNSRPYVEAKVYDYAQGIRRLNWTRLYTGVETDNHHGIAFDGEGSMHRIRIDGSDIYHQKITSPGSGSTYSSWTKINAGISGAWLSPTAHNDPDTHWSQESNAYEGAVTNQTWVEKSIPAGAQSVTAMRIRYSHTDTSMGLRIFEAAFWQDPVAVTADGPCAIAAHGAKVYIFWRKNDNTIRKYYSHDYGGSWTDAELSTYSNADSMAAAWWSTGNIVVLVSTNSTVADGELNAIVLNSSTQAKTEYTHTESVAHPILDFYGIGVTYAASPERMCIVFAAKEDGSLYDFYALYRTELSSIYNWLSLDYFLSVPHGENINYQYPDIHLPPSSPQAYEHCQFTAVEVFAGDTAYNRPLRFNAVKSSEFSEMAYIEPMPFLNISSTYGLRLASTTDYFWAERPDGVWRAPRPPGTALDLTADIVSLKQSIPGDLVVELDNSSGTYATPGAGAIALLKQRSELVLKLGYNTSIGDESSQAGTYWIDSWEWSSSKGRASFILHCIDGGELSVKYLAHTQLRWNDSAVNPKTTWELLKAVLCRFGVCLVNAANRSTPITSLYPQLLINPGQSGSSALSSLLRTVPDLLDYQHYSSGYSCTVAATKEPRITDSSDYEYRIAAGYHLILEGFYRETTPLSQVRSKGRDSSDNPLLASSFDWDLLGMGIDNFQPVYDPELQTETRNQERADALLRQSDLQAVGAQIVVPVNCGQELYDIVTVTDERCGISAALYRVMAIQVDYSPRNGIYTQLLTLGKR